PPSALAVVRIALLAGVLTFGAVVYFLQRGEDWRPADLESLSGLRIAMLAVWTGAAVLLIILRLRLTALTDTAGRTMLIVAWATGEGAALSGGLYHMLSGDLQWFIIGLFSMLASFILFPIRRTSPPPTRMRDAALTVGSHIRSS